MVASPSRASVSLTREPWVFTAASAAGSGGGGGSSSGGGGGGSASGSGSSSEPQHHVRATVRCSAIFDFLRLYLEYLEYHLVLLGVI